jgi:hypothetical protein
MPCLSHGWSVRIVRKSYVDPGGADHGALAAQEETKEERAARPDDRVYCHHAAYRRGDGGSGLRLLLVLPRPIARVPRGARVSRRSGPLFAVARVWAEGSQRLRLRLSRSRVSTGFERVDCRVSTTHAVSDRLGVGNSRGLSILGKVARMTGLEPATSGVTGEVVLVRVSIVSSSCSLRW